jgi:DNA replication licensing factor MCM3
VTVRTLETLLRLATAHAKLSLKKEVGAEDIDMALKLLNMTIFREELQDEVEDKADAEMDEEPVEDKEEVVPLAQKSSRAMRRDKRGK